ncbi:MAG: putative addiction module antidote protein [Bryobacteraceae bacterium]|nr:putative addiction module antidote protein [Bryobacteraceae bacterium]
MSKPVITLRPYEDLLHQWLSDPEEALVYLNVALEDEDPRVFLLALRDVAKVQGWSRAGKGRVNRENLYRRSSRAGNPSLKSLSAVLGALGLRLSVRRAPVERKKKRTA